MNEQLSFSRKMIGCLNESLLLIVIRKHFAEVVAEPFNY